jgi:phospholipid-binding lipoprotein MlaA
VLAILLAGAFAGSPWAQQAGAPEPKVFDPLRPLNVLFFDVNDHVFVPVYRGYAAVVPEHLRQGLDNVARNLRVPARTVNALLQLKPREAGRQLQAFVLNTTVGILGWRDAARDRTELQIPAEDLGQTLGRYRVPEGPALTLPVLGTSNLRDLLGRVGDGFLDPLMWLGTPATAAVGANAASLRLEQYDRTLALPPAPYEAMRNSYTLRRRAQVAE